MFRTDLNHLLQSIDSHLFYKFMEYVSFMGTIYVLMLTILVLISGIDFRKGFLVLNILGWGVLLMLFAKNYVDYPRPIAVDPTLESFDKEKMPEDLTALQPIGFFDRFSDELLEKTRASDIGRYGFPSGHVMIITAIWIGMALLFRKLWLWVLSILLVVLTIFSRMYLGVHYLGDVVGGLIIGLILSLGFYAFFSKLRLTKNLMLQPKHVLFFMAPVILILFYKIVPGFQSGGLIGFNLALLLILQLWGEPKLSSSIAKRIANIFLFTIIYFAGYFLAKQLPLDKTGLISISTFTLINFIVLMVFFFIGEKLSFYKIVFKV